MDKFVELVARYRPGTIIKALFFLYCVTILTIISSPAQAFLALKIVKDSVPHQRVAPYAVAFPVVARGTAVSVLVLSVMALTLNVIAGRVWANHLSPESKEQMKTRFELKRQVETLCVHLTWWFWILVLYGALFGLSVTESTTILDVLIFGPALLIGLSTVAGKLVCLFARP